MAITKRRKLFIETYLKTWNATASAKAAGYSERSAYSQGQRMLKIAEVSEAIEARITEATMSANEVLTRLAEHARGSQLPFVRISDDGFVYFDFSNPEAKEYFHLIKKIKTKRSRRVEGKGADAETWEDEWVEVELHDSQAALALLARYHKLLNDRVDVTTNGKDIAAVTVYIPNNGRDN